MIKQKEGNKVVFLLFFLQREHLWRLLITGKTRKGKTLTVRCKDKPEKMSSLFKKKDLTFFIYHLMFFAEVLQLLKNQINSRIKSWLHTPILFKHTLRFSLAVQQKGFKVAEVGTHANALLFSFHKGSQLFRQGDIAFAKHFGNRAGKLGRMGCFKKNALLPFF